VWVGPKVSRDEGRVVCCGGVTVSSLTYVTAGTSTLTSEGRTLEQRRSLVVALTYAWVDKDTLGRTSSSFFLDVDLSKNAKSLVRNHVIIPETTMSLVHVLSLVVAQLLLQLLLLPHQGRCCCTAFAVHRHNLHLATAPRTTRTKARRTRHYDSSSLDRDGSSWNRQQQGAFVSSRSDFGDVSLFAKPRNIKNQVELGDTRKSSSSLPFKTDTSSRNKSSSSSSSGSKSNNNNNSSSSNWQKSSYNDDAFGLVFLGGGLVAQDALFAGLFLMFSTMAAIATNSKSGYSVPGNNPRLAGSVAGVTIVVRLVLLVLHVTLPPLPLLDLGASGGGGGDGGDGGDGVLTASTIWSEIALCSASMLYGFVIAPSSLSDDKEEE
jgi:hypothetical protein